MSKQVQSQTKADLKDKKKVSGLECVRPGERDSETRPCVLRCRGARAGLAWPAKATSWGYL